MKRSGFTLVELLVVIGIIALLISILLPSLNQARASARKVACLSNQRQIAVATHNYASEQRGFVAPRFRFVSNATLIANPGAASPYTSPQWATYFYGNYGGSTPPTPFNLGTLTNAGYMQVGVIDPNDVETYPKFFYCPSQPAGNNYAGTDPDPTKRFRSGYQYNAHAALLRTSGADVLQTRFQKLIDFEDDKSLTSDVIDAYADINHQDGESELWNLSFSDGHASSAKSEAVGDIMFGTTGANGRSVAGKWDRMNDYRDVLEKIATGQSPLIDGGQYGGYNWGGNRRDPFVYLN